MNTQNKKELLLEQLRKMPIVQIACEKTGVARATYYRWRENKEFRKNADDAITEGETLITEMSESQLVSLIRDKNFASIQLWLRVHHPKYATKVELNGSITCSDEELTPEQASIVKEALRLASFGANSNDKSKETDD